MSIIDTAKAGGLNMFLAALSAAKLTSLFESNGPLGPFTVFAPSDAAFGAIPEDVKQLLFADPEGALTDLLLRHVIVRKTMSEDDLVAAATPDVHAPGATIGHTIGTSPAKGIGRSIQAVGGKLGVMVVGAGGPGDLVIGSWRSYKGAKIITPNIDCTNGVVHIVDKVLLAAPTTASSSSGSSDSSAFMAAGALAGMGTGLIFLVGAHQFLQHRRAKHISQ